MHRHLSVNKNLNTDKQKYPYHHFWRYGYNYQISLLQEYYSSFAFTNTSTIPIIATMRNIGCQLMLRSNTDLIPINSNDTDKSKLNRISAIPWSCRFTITPPYIWKTLYLKTVFIDILTNHYICFKFVFQRIITVHTRKLRLAYRSGSRCTSYNSIRINSFYRCIPRIQIIRAIHRNCHRCFVIRTIKCYTWKKIKKGFLRGIVKLNFHAREVDVPVVETVVSVVL